VTDPNEVERLSQWPVAVVLHDVWRFVGDPHLVDDLGMEDRKILAGAQDGIIREPLEKLSALWAALKDRQVEPAALPPPANFYDSGAPVLVGTKLPTIPSDLAAEEGKLLWSKQYRVERDPALSREAKRLNAAKFGIYTCEACDFKHQDGAMFDAHHPTPLAIGVRKTFSKHLEVLCPTCHRRAHLSGDRLRPFTVQQLREWVSAWRI
jgi:hypothetical protein